MNQKDIDQAFGNLFEETDLDDPDFEKKLNDILKPVIKDHVKKSLLKSELDKIDMFAAHAMQALVACGCSVTDPQLSIICERSYALAIGMIKERDKLDIENLIGLK